ncbi:MAG: type 1 glutamine amidotransferase [Spirochaetales bacterium]|nr:type 1 glutamine amidotransferase [Spirochaetales bacterium]
MEITVFTHVPFEGPAAIAPWAESRGHSLRIVHLYRGDRIPVPSDWLIVMGGPMGALDDAKYPWFGPEKKAIDQAIASGRTVIGVCLGAQLIAAVLGARVFRNAEREIGWFDVALHQPAAGRVFGDHARLRAFHWHGDTFDLPAGADLLGSTPGCKNQAFLYRDRVLGLQFHLEATRESIESLIRECPDDLLAGPFVQTAAAMLDRQPEHAALFELLDNLEKGETNE